MTDKRFSLIAVLISVAVAAGIALFSLSAGLFIGFQWGKSTGREEAIAELPVSGARAIGPLLEELFPGGELPRGGPEQFIPRSGQGEGPLSNRPYLGVTFRMISPELQDQEGLDEEHGAWIVEVVPGSPADEAGLRKGDVIHAVDGAEVNERHSLVELIGVHHPGDEIELTVIRNGRRVPIEVELGARPAGGSLEGKFLGRFLGEMVPGFHFQGEMPEGFHFEFQCGDETCRFPEDLDKLEGFEGFEG